MPEAAKQSTTEVGREDGLGSLGDDIRLAVVGGEIEDGD